MRLMPATSVILGCALAAGIGPARADSAAGGVMGVGVQIGFAEFGSFANGDTGLLTRSLQIARERAIASGCIPTGEIDGLIAAMAGAAQSRDVYPRITAYRQRLEVIVERNCDCGPSGGSGGPMPPLPGANPPLPLPGGTTTVPSGPVYSDMTQWRVDAGRLEIREGGLYTAAPGDGVTSYFIAPGSFLGSWTGRTTLSFEKKSWGGSYYASGYGSRGDVVIHNGTKTAAYAIPQDHSQQWRAVRVPLGGGAWTLGGGATSLADVLSNVTKLEIRAEYGAGTDYAQIRNVVLQ